MEENTQQPIDGYTNPMMDPYGQQNAAADEQPVQEPAAAAEPKGEQVKCPKCGATDISLNMNNGKLRCNYCRHEFDPIASDKIVEDASKLEGENVSSGAADINDSQSSQITIKCKSCGAEVVVDTEHTTGARCHWCRSHLSINDVIPNGAVPDMILPFQVKKEEAQRLINNFVGERRFFAHPRFKKEFTTDNIMGVYFPYMIVDANEHVDLQGEGEVLLRSYYVGDKNNKRKYYDADVYDVEREFDIAIKGLTVESSKQRLNNKSKSETNNVINSIMPFDTEHCVKYDSNYLRGFTSEKRDVNVEELKPIVTTQLSDISRHAAVPSLEKFDRGVKWTNELYKVLGINWSAAYLPVWLYSYMDTNKMLHYVAVNARTKETMGSVPINKGKLFLFSTIVEIIAIILMILMIPFFDSCDDEANIFPYLFLLAGPLFWWWQYSRYRNQGARHYHEKETQTEMSNENFNERRRETRKRLSNSRISGENYMAVKGSTV